jgi:hypothetical protein
LGGRRHPITENANRPSVPYSYPIISESKEKPGHWALRKYRFPDNILWARGQFTEVVLWFVITKI